MAMILLSRHVVPSPTEVRAMLSAAFKNLPLNSGMQTRVTLRVDLLAPLAKAAPGVGRASPMFRDANRATCAREIRRLIVQTEKLAKLSKRSLSRQSTRAKTARMLGDTVSGFHRPTILALADVGILGEQRQSLEAISKRLGMIKNTATEVEMRLLHFTAAQAGLADVSNVPTVATRGRPVNNLAMGVIRILHGEFEPLTGKRPTRTVKSDLPGSPASGYFFNLVRDVFVALGIKANPETYVRAILKERKAGPAGEAGT